MKNPDQESDRTAGSAHDAGPGKAIETEHGRFTIRAYRAVDESAVLSLWLAAFGRPMLADLWQWKYHWNPYGHKALVCFGEDQAALAYFGGIPYRLIREGKAAEAIVLLDIMSHPAFRGAGLFARTGRLYLETFGTPGGALLLYGLPGKYHYDLGVRILQYQGLQAGVDYLAARPGQLKGARRFGGLIERVSRVDERFDRLWRQCRRDYPFAVIRDAEFLDWRFCRHPAERYEIWIQRSFLGKRILGYAVLLEKEGGMQLVDLLAPAAGRAGDFLARLAEVLLRRGIEAVGTWLPGGHFLARELQTAGFRPQPEPLGIIPTVRVFGHSPPVEWLSRHFFFTMADADLF